MSKPPFPYLPVSISLPVLPVSPSLHHYNGLPLPHVSVSLQALYNHHLPMVSRSPQMPFSMPSFHAGSRSSPSSPCSCRSRRCSRTSSTFFHAIPSAAVDGTALRTAVGRFVRGAHTGGGGEGILRCCWYLSRDLVLIGQGAYCLARGWTGRFSGFLKVTTSPVTPYIWRNDQRGAAGNIAHPHARR